MHNEPRDYYKQSASCLPDSPLLSPCSHLGASLLLLPRGLENTLPDLPLCPASQPIALGAAWPGGPLFACCQRGLEC